MHFETFSFPSRRSNIIARHGLVATSQPLAAQAGLAILQQGGNAIDAAIATVATLCVVEPTSTGIGGDAFALIWIAKEKKLYGLNASGPAPMGLTAELLRRQGHHTFPELGPLTVTVPGAVRGWQLALERFGTLPLARLLTQPIDYAQHGFPVSQRIAAAWQRSESKMSQHADSRRVWLPNGRAPRPAQLFQNPEFAHTLRLLASDGPDAFYFGPISQQIATAVQSAGGVLQQQDLAAYQAEWSAPISTPYGRDYAFHEIPPNGQGLTALIALNIAQQLGIDQLPYGSSDYYHLLIEATKLAFADAETYIADPRHTPIPLEGLLSQPYAQQRSQLIQTKAQAPQAGSPSPHGDTVYLTVADEEGNMVSWIQSLYMGFGSGITAGTSGVQLQNRAANFSLQPGHANEVAPGKRPYHTIIPGFITYQGQAWSSFGVMGGFMQPQGHLQVGLNAVAFGMDPQTALDAPRFNWLKEKTVALETAVHPTIRQQLAQRGHQIAPLDQPVHYGGGQLIVRDPATGVLIGGSEPRNDGTAVGF